MSSLLPSIVVLGLAAIAALTLAVRRPPIPVAVDERRAASMALGVAVLAQGAHFAEELITGFPVALGSVFGLPSMSARFFLAFNLLWLGLWVLAIPGVRGGWRPAYFAAWFLAIAGVANGVLHPLLAVASRGYFPGLATALFIAAAGVFLWTRLLRATRPLEA